MPNDKETYFLIEIWRNGIQLEDAEYYKLDIAESYISQQLRRGCEVRIKKVTK